MNALGPILLFDGECNLCDSLVQFVKRHDMSKTIMFTPLHSDAGSCLLASYGFNHDYLDSAVYIKEKKVYLRSTAILNLLRDLGGGWRLLYGFVIIPDFIRDFFYNIIARSRYRIYGKRVSCILPDGSSGCRILK